MSLQTNYADNIAVGYAGAIANQEPCTLISRTVEDSGGVAFGLAVMQGAKDKGCTVSDGTSFLGVTVRDQSVAPEAPDTFEFLANARIMTKGVIWIANSGGVTADDSVEALADGALGAATSGNVANARWDTSAEDGELALLRLA
jgi:hypothetical protein